jgi:hypothetical protein
MRNACDACICSVFRYLENQLTVLPGAGIAGKFLPSEIPSKSFAWGREVKIAPQRRQIYRQKHRRKISLDGDRRR